MIFLLTPALRAPDSVRTHHSLFSTPTAHCPTIHCCDPVTPHNLLQASLSNSSARHENSHSNAFILRTPPHSNQKSISHITAGSIVTDANGDKEQFERSPAVIVCEIPHANSLTVAATLEEN